VREFEREDPEWEFAFLFDLDQDFGEYVERMQKWRQGKALPEGWVPNTFFVGLVADRVVGRLSLRHELNEFLRDFGGHVGFAVVPSARRRGYATEMLRLTFPHARSVGIDRLLVTCDDDNVASQGVIERCGGVLEDRRVRGGGGLTRRYWIGLD
jgi:predicted acetyltransferase